MPRHLVPRIAAGLVAVVGLAVLAVAALLASRADGSVALVGRYTATGTPVVTAVPGTLELVGKGVQVRATAARPGDRVFVGVGRADDVQAYLGAVSRSEITGLDPEHRLTARTQGAEPSLPDPATMDVWALSQSGTGSATLVWPEVPGRWQLVVATDGAAAAPATLSLTWTRPATAPASVPALVGVGALLLIGGTVVFVVLWLRRKAPQATAGEEEGTYPFDDIAGAAGAAPGERPLSPRRAARAAAEAAEAAAKAAAPPPLRQRPAPSEDPDATRQIARVDAGMDARTQAPAAAPAAAEDAGLFTPRAPQPVEHAGVIDRRMATPGLAPDLPTVQLRLPAETGAEPEPDPEDADRTEHPDHPTTVLRRVRVDRPWSRQGEPGAEPDDRTGDRS